MKDEKNVFLMNGRIDGWTDRRTDAHLGQKESKRSFTQLHSRKRNTAFLDRVTTAHKGSSTPTKMSKIIGRQIH